MNIEQTNKISYIYELIDPETNRVRYIGKTNNPKNRLKKHLNECTKLGIWTPKNQWLFYLKNKGLKPIMNIIDKTSDEKINQLEIDYISKYRELYEDLTNDTDGGDGYNWIGRKHTPDTIERLKLCHPSRKIILQFDLENNFIKKYLSTREIDNELELNRRSVVRCCNGQTLLFKGYYFRFSDNFFPCELAKPIENMREIQKILDNSQLEKLPTKRKQKTIDNHIKIKEEKFKNKKPKKKYVQYDLEGNILGRFIGIMEASSKSGCHTQLISTCCKNKQYYTVNGTTFRYEGDEFDYIPYNKYVQSGSKKVSKYTLNGIFVCEFDSIKRAAAELGGRSNQNNISICCNNKYRKNGKSLIVKGFTYRFSEDSF